MPDAPTPPAAGSDKGRDTWREDLRLLGDEIEFAGGVLEAREALARVAGELERLEGDLLENDRLVESAWKQRDDETEKAMRAEQEVARLRDGLRQRIERLQTAFQQRPPETPGRDTYADGYTSGLVEALYLVNDREARSLLSGGGALDADVAQNHERATGPSDPDEGTRSLDAESMSEPPSASSALSGGQAESTKEQG